MYWTLFMTFMRIGMFTIGGGYAMLPLIQRDVVDRGWMTKEEFIDIFSVAQSLPGIFAVNISIFVGYKLKRIGGSIVCALGTILPSFLIILLIGDPFKGLIYSQMILSIQLPFTVFLQVHLTSSERVMGKYRNSRFTKYLLYGIGAVVTVLNVMLLVSFFR